MYEPNFKQIWDEVYDTIKFLIHLPYFIYLLIISITNYFHRSIFCRKIMRWDSETILVTGAALGIGREVVLKLAKVSKNCTFILWDINESGLNETTQRCRELGVLSVYSYVIDLSKRENVTQMAAKVRKIVGPVTVLFNNAGVLQYNNFLDVRPEVEEAIIHINLLSYMWTIREFLPDMIKNRRGHLINTCSAMAHYRFCCMSAYVASKYGLDGFLKCLKLEMKYHPHKPDIKFTTIYPGWVKTGMTTGIKLEPRYKTWNILKHASLDIVSSRIVEGILQKQEEVYVPRNLRFLKLIFGTLPIEYFDRVEKFLYPNMNIYSSIEQQSCTVKQQKSSLFNSEQYQSSIKKFK